MIKKILNNNHKGSMAVEQMIMFPIIFITFAMLVYITMMAFTYVYYNALANNIANDFNIGNTGYSQQLRYNLPSIKMSTINANGTSDGATYITDDKINIDVRNTNHFPVDFYSSKSQTQIYGKYHLYYVLEKYNNVQKNGGSYDIFQMPYSELDGINVTFDNPLFYNNCRGVAIKVTISYKSMIFGLTHLPSIKASGYSIIM